MIKAGALYYAVLISFIAALLSGFIILLSFHYNTYLDTQLIEKQLQKNVYSGINLYLTNPDFISFNTQNQLDIYDDETEIVAIQKKKWGVYDVLEVSSKRRNIEYRKIILVGENIFMDNENIALYLPDKGKYLSLSGKSSIRGNCYTSKLGVRRDAIEGQSFQGDILVDGKIKNSSKSLPNINDEILKFNKDYLLGNFPQYDSLVNFDKILRYDSVVNSFRNKTLLLFAQNRIDLGKGVFKGNIRIVSNKAIEVFSSVKLENVILYAPVVIIHEGFTGNIQVFSEKEMNITKNCKLTYPSAVGLISQVKDEIIFLIDENAVVEGGVFMKCNVSDKKIPVMKINNNARILGQAYCSGNVQLKGNIFGSLYCNGFILKTVSSTYENHILNANIDFNKLPVDYIGVNFVYPSKRKEMIEWLN